MTPLYKKVEQFVKESFEKAGKPQSFPHLKRTTYWIKQLNPNADEALLIAGVSHDVERAFVKNWINGSLILTADLIKHSNLSAEIIAKFLLSEKVDDTTIKKVKLLVFHHETGGSNDENILKDADSISFLENNVDHFIKLKATETSYDFVKEKFDYMFNRISSPIARKIAEPMYQNAIRNLNDK
jgi:hypothetical protein